MPALTPEQIAKLRADGKTLRELAAEVGVSITTILRWADPAFRARQKTSQRRSKRRNRARVEAGRKRYLERTAPRCSRCSRPLTRTTASRQPVLCGACIAEVAAERKRRIWQLSERGYGPTAIATRLGVPKGTVANDMRKLRARGDLAPARSSGLDPALDGELIALYEDGLPLADIARALGRHKRTITQRLARLRAHGVVGRRAPSPELRPPAAPPGLTARAEIARELGFESNAGMRGREQRIAAEDPELVARERVTPTGHDGQLAVFYGPELAAQIRRLGPRRHCSHPRVSRG